MVIFDSAESEAWGGRRVQKGKVRLQNRKRLVMLKVTVLWKE